jgi:hypothetical protein
MPKEVTFAILIGFILGLLITFGIYTANKAVKEQGQQTKTEAAVVPTPSPIADQNLLTISAPTDEELFTKPEITVSGKTNPEAAVAFLTEEDEYFTQADSDGFFSQEITLVAGINRVEIISTDAFGKQAQTTLMLSYSNKITQSSDQSTDEQ